jgi:hypothetical protein
VICLSVSQLLEGVIFLLILWAISQIRSEFAYVGRQYPVIEGIGSWDGGWIKQETMCFATKVMTTWPGFPIALALLLKPCSIVTPSRLSDKRPCSNPLLMIIW